jgi:hypothetical protein
VAARAFAQIVEREPGDVIGLAHGADAAVLDREGAVRLTRLAGDRGERGLELARRVGPS